MGAVQRVLGLHVISSGDDVRPCGRGLRPRAITPVLARDPLVHVISPTSQRIFFKKIKFRLNKSEAANDLFLGRCPRVTRNFISMALRLRLVTKGSRTKSLLEQTSLVPLILGGSLPKTYFHVGF